MVSNRWLQDTLPCTILSRIFLNGAAGQIPKGKRVVRIDLERSLDPSGMIIKNAQKGGILYFYQPNGRKRLPKR